MGTSLAPQFPFAILNRNGLALQEVITSRIDLVGELYRERFSNRSFANVIVNAVAVQAWQDADTWRYTGTIGIRVGPARVGMNGSYIRRIQPEGARTILVWADVTFGVFQLRNR
jgi:hypothetical protein